MMLYPYFLFVILIEFEKNIVTCISTTNFCHIMENSLNKIENINSADVFCQCNVTNIEQIHKMHKNILSKADHHRNHQ